MKKDCHRMNGIKNARPKYSLLLTYIGFICLLCTFKSASTEQYGRCHCDGHVVCKKVNDMDDLKAYLYELSDCGGDNLKLKKCQLPALPDSLLQESRFSRLRIQDSAIYFLYPSFLDGSPFTGGDSVLDFTLDNVEYIYNWNWTHLNHMQNLNALRIINSDLLYISVTFSTVALTSLHVLIIENSGVKWIHEGAFSLLEGISYLHLVKNEIHQFKRNYLPQPAKYLHVFSLRSNKLKSIDEDLFTGMPSLKFVNLESNNIVTISENIPVQSELFINLKGNKLYCRCSIRWLLDEPNIKRFDTKHLKCYDEKKSRVIPLKKVFWEDIGCRIYFELFEVDGSDLGRWLDVNTTNVTVETEDFWNSFDKGAITMQFELDVETRNTSDSASESGGREDSSSSEFDNKKTVAEL